MGGRPLMEVKGEYWTDWLPEFKQGRSSGGLLLQSLPKGPTTPSGPSGCTHNPGNHGGICPNR
ncbi:hypothetical protein HPP92_023531 [Vanilla planifolia]|nr:hypothetical protein HPP92_023531 [Vanilla planifolia]